MKIIISYYIYLNKLLFPRNKNIEKILSYELNKYYYLK